jgi:hypothetical protein
MEALFTFLAERYERRTVIITSNRVLSEWDRIFKYPMTTAAAIDRLVHHSVILEMTGSSIRVEHAHSERAPQGGITPTVSEATATTTPIRWRPRDPKKFGSRAPLLVRLDGSNSLGAAAASESGPRFCAIRAHVWSVEWAGMAGGSQGASGVACLIVRERLVMAFMTAFEARGCDRMATPFNRHVSPMSALEMRPPHLRVMQWRSVHGRPRRRT